MGSTDYTLDYDRVRAHRRVAAEHEYDVARVQLYGVGVGLGFEHQNPQQLAFLRDDSPEVLPTFATVAAWDVQFLLELGIDWSKLIHASQSVDIITPLPSAARLTADVSIEAAYDKPDRNATIFVVRTELRARDSGAALAVLRSVSLARDFRVAGAPVGKPTRLAPPPDREPDITVTLPTSTQVALVYRLLGGRSLIHFDPVAARAQGFDGPIMHGLSAFGHACHATLRGVCDYDVSRMQGFAADFSTPTYPGEILETRLWKTAAGVHFETYALPRDVKVLANGFAPISPR